MLQRPMTTNAALQRLGGAGAGAYAAIAHEGDGGGYMQLMQHITDDVAPALGGKEGEAAVLDVGSGSGQPALQIAKALP